MGNGARIGLIVRRISSLLKAHPLSRVGDPEFPKFEDAANQACDEICDLGPGRHWHIRNHAFGDVVTLSARQFAKQSQSKKTAGDNQEREQSHLTQTGS